MNDKTRNPSPGMPGHENDDESRTDRQARPGENEERNRSGQQGGERQTGQGGSGQSGQNPSKQRDD